MPEIEIVRLSADMLPEVAALEALCFAEPWSEKSLELLLSERGIGFAALVDGQLAAYGGMMTVLDEGQITNIATFPEFRRMGIGRRIVKALEEYSVANGIVFLSLEVRESNAPAQALYASCGWQSQGIRRNFYRLPTENAVIMTKKL